METFSQQEGGDFTNSRVLILSGRYKGREGVCVGKSANSERWAVSPDGSDLILELLFKTEFSLIIDLSGNPVRN